MFLLADVNWENLTAIATIGGAIAWLIRTYAPRVIEHHLGFVSAVEQQGERQTAALEKLAERDVSGDVKRINEALHHGARAAATLVEGTDREPKVMPHLQAMRNSLRPE